MSILSAEAPAMRGKRESAPERRWSVKVGDRIYGPYTAQNMCRYVEEGRIVPYSIVQPTDGGAWRPASDDPFIGALFTPEPDDRPEPAQAAPVSVEAVLQEARARAAQNRQNTARPESLRRQPTPPAAQPVTPVPVQKPDPVPLRVVPEAVLEPQETATPVEHRATDKIDVEMVFGDEPSEIDLSDDMDHAMEAVAEAHAEMEPQAEADTQPVTPAAKQEFFDYQVPLDHEIDETGKTVEQITVCAIRGLLNDPVLDEPLSAPKAVDRGLRESTPLTTFLIVTGAPHDPEADMHNAIRMLGETVRITPTVWLLAARHTPGTVRNHLIQYAQDQEQVFVIDAKTSRSAWFNLAPECDAKIREILEARA